MKRLTSLFLLLLSLPALSQTLTVKSLYDEYRANRSSFESKYRNRQLTVSGKVRSISRGSAYWKDAHRVHLTATGYENFVVCQLPYADSAALNRLKVGDVVTVTGTTGATLSDAVFLSDGRFGAAAAPPVSKASAAPADAPLGKYNVYQNDGTGFNFQYTFYLKSYTGYTLNGKSGTCAYDAKSKVILFGSGPLKGFAGLYRPTTDNPADPPGFLLDAKGTVPVAASSHHGYQMAYYKGK